MKGALQCDTKRTHNLLQDLLFSKIVVERSTTICPFDNHQPVDPNNGGISRLKESLSVGDSLLQENPSQIGQSCSICSGDNQIGPISEEEMELLLKVVFNSAPMNFDIVLTSRCKMCALTLATLTKLKKQIEDMILCLRAVLKLRNDTEISALNVVGNTSEICGETHHVIMTPDHPVDDEEDLKPNIKGMELDITDLEDNEEELGEDLCENENKNTEISAENSSTETTATETTKNPESGTNSVLAPKPTCQICGVSFSSKYSLKSHMSKKWIHKKMTKNPQKKEKKPQQNDAQAVAMGEDIKPIIIGLDLEISDVEDNNDEVVPLLDDDSNMITQQPTQRSTLASKVECQLCRSAFSSSSQLKRHLLAKGAQRCKGKEWKEKSYRTSNKEDYESDQESESDAVDNNERITNEDSQDQASDHEASDHAPANYNGRVKRKSRIRAEKLLKSMANDTNDNKTVSKKQRVEVESSDSDNHYSSESSTDEENENNTESALKRSKEKVEEVEEVSTQGHINVCEQCGMCFIAKSALVLHLANRGWHKGQYKPKRTDKCKMGRKKCELCHLNFVCGNAYYTHLRLSMHRMALKHKTINEEGVVSFECPYCEEIFKKVDELIQHKKFQECRKHTCEPCDKRFATGEAYNRHLRGSKHMQKVLDYDGIDLEKDCKFRCDICGKGFLHKNNLRQHNAYHHDKQFMCEICGKAFGAPAGLKYHHDSQHANEGKANARPHPRKSDRFVAPKDKPFGCLNCPKRFQHWESLQRHNRTEHQGFRFRCNNCPMEFKALKCFKQHKAKAHNPTDEIVIKTIAPKEKVRYPCDICSFSTTNTSALLRHIELKHLPNKNSCLYGCPDKMVNEDEWIQHLKQCKSPKLGANSRCKCPVCGDLFTNQLLKMDHQLKQHNTYSCEFCDTKFVNKMSLDLHIMQHEESKQAKAFLCTKCGKRFRQKYNLDLHSTTVCGDDEKARKELLAKRREQHRVFRDKDKPHKCDQCSKSFILEDKLKAHMKNVHGNAESQELD